MVKIPFWTNWILDERRKAYEEGWKIRNATAEVDFEKYEQALKTASEQYNRLVTIHKEQLEIEKKSEFKRGRDFEFKTMNHHLEALYKYQPSEDAMFLLHRWRETMK